MIRKEKFEESSSDIYYYHHYYDYLEEKLETLEEIDLGI